MALSAESKLRGAAGVLSRRRVLAGLLAGTGALLDGCSGTSSIFSNRKFFSSAPSTPAQTPATTIGAGQVKVGLILPLSAAGDAGLAAQAMRNAAQMAYDEFNQPNIQILVEDDGGTPQGAQAAAEQALGQAAAIILGPLFAQSVSSAAQVARGHNVPIIAFSTDVSVASPGVYLLSFLPQSDVERIVQYATTRGKRSYAALVPQNPYGSVVEVAFRQDLARHGGRLIALEHYPHDPAAMAAPVRTVGQAANRASALFIPDGGDIVPSIARMLVADGVNTRRIQLLGTGLWNDPRIFATQALDGGWYAAPPAGYGAFSKRYRARFQQDPVRTATLAYDAVALVAALVKTQPDPQQRFSQQELTNPSGFTGIDGLFRFRADGSNQRGLAVMRVTASGGQVISPAPRSFAAS